MKPTPRILEMLAAQGKVVAKPKRVSKYRNVKVTVDGITFDSKREAERYGELRLLQKSGAIRMLQRQYSFRLEVNGMLICVYRSDFTYEERVKAVVPGLRWRWVVEDVKGVLTPVYRLKKKLMVAIHGIEIREVRR